MLLRQAELLQQLPKDHQRFIGWLVTTLFNDYKSRQFSVYVMRGIGIDTRLAVSTRKPQLLAFTFTSAAISCGCGFPLPQLPLAAPRQRHNSNSHSTADLRIRMMGWDDDGAIASTEPDQFRPQRQDGTSRHR